MYQVLGLKVPSASELSIWLLGAQGKEQEGHWLGHLEA